MITEHAQAVLALFDEFPHTVYDGQVPDKPAFPYVVLYLDTGVESATKLCATSDMANLRFQATSVGLTAEAARIVADAVRDRVLDVRLSVTGRSYDPIRHENGIPVRQDTSVTDVDTGLHPMFAVDTYHAPSHS